MKDESKKVIKKIAEFIDRDKYNPILTSRGYDKFLENVLTKLVEGVLEIEK